MDPEPVTVEQDVADATLSPSDRVIVHLLALGAKDAAICQLAGISQTTLSRRKLDPKIQEAIQADRRRSYEGLLLKFNNLTDVAIDKLRDAIENAGRVSSRLRAIEMWFDMRLKVQHDIDVVAKLERIEARLDAQDSAKDTARDGS